jgi:hypothetical protein
MFIRWLSYTSRAKLDHIRNRRREDSRLTPVLVESVRIDGKPRQRHIATLPSITARRSPCRFWEGVTGKLNALGNRLLPRLIQALLAAQLATETLNTVAKSLPETEEGKA